MRESPRMAEGRGIAGELKRIRDALEPHAKSSYESAECIVLSISEASLGLAE